MTRQTYNTCLWIKEIESLLSPSNHVHEVEQELLVWNIYRIIRIVEITPTEFAYDFNNYFN